MSEMYLGKFYVYAHLLPSGEEFYIGSGAVGRGFLPGGGCGYKAKKAQKGIWWDIVKAVGGHWSVKILAWFETKQDALRVEKHLIQHRKPRGNQAHNGDCKFEIRRRPHTAATCLKIIQARAAYRERRDAALTAAGLSHLIPKPFIRRKHGN